MGNRDDEYDYLFKGEKSIFFSLYYFGLGACHLLVRILIYIIQRVVANLKYFRPMCQKNSRHAMA